MILSDRDIRKAIDEGRLKIVPLHDDTIRENGVDLRLGGKSVSLLRSGVIMDTRKAVLPDNFREVDFDEKEGLIVYPDERVLVNTLEYVALPDDLMGFCCLRSTFARLGLFTPPTIIDAGFEGELVIELVGGAFPVKLYKGQRFLHVVFCKLTSPVEKPYRGQYQRQRGVVLPKFETEKEIGGEA